MKEEINKLISSLSEKINILIKSNELASLKPKFNLGQDIWIKREDEYADRINGFKIDTKFPIEECFRKETNQLSEEMKSLADKFKM